MVKAKVVVALIHEEHHILQPEDSSFQNHLFEYIVPALLSKF